VSSEAATALALFDEDVVTRRYVTKAQALEAAGLWV
jgi:hypothetical protein